MIPSDGGDYADYVNVQLELARLQAQAEVKVGDGFTYVLTDIARGITSPHDIMFGIMMSAGSYGLQVNIMMDEQIEFTRTE